MQTILLPNLSYGRHLNLIHIYGWWSHLVRELKEKENRNIHEDSDEFKGKETVLITKLSLIKLNVKFKKIMKMMFALKSI